MNDLKRIEKMLFECEDASSHLLEASFPICDAKVLAQRTARSKRGWAAMDDLALSLSDIHVMICETMDAIEETINFLNDLQDQIESDE